MVRPSAPRCDLAVQYLLNGRAKTGKEALQLTCLFTPQEANDKSKQRNVLQRAQRQYDKEHGAGAWKEFRANIPPTNNNEPRTNHKQQQTKTAKIQRCRSRPTHKTTDTIAHKAKASARAKRRGNTPLPQLPSKARKVCMPKDRPFRLTPSQCLKLAAENSKRQKEYDEATAKAVNLYREERDNGMSSAKVSRQILAETQYVIAPTTIRMLANQERTTTVRRGRKGIFDDEQFKALSEAFVTYIALQQVSKGADCSGIDLKEKLQALVHDVVTMDIDTLFKRLKKANAHLFNADDEYIQEMR